MRLLSLRRILLLAVPLAALLGWVMLMDHHADATAVDPGPAGTPAHGFQPTAHVPPTPERRDATAPTGLVAVDDRDGTVLTRARLCSPAPDAESFDGEAAVVRADAAGLMAWPTTDQTLILYCPGYVAELVPPLPSGAAPNLRRIALRAAATIRIRIVDQDQNPVPDVDVTLGAARGVTLARGRQPGCIGHPASAQPIWTGWSNQAGDVVLGDLPPASYRLRCFHDAFVPTTQAGVGGSPVTAPTDLVIEMVEMLCAVAILPESEDFASYQWSYSKESMDQSVPVQIARTEVLAKLRERFPQAVCAVALPLRLAKQLVKVFSVRCEAVTRSGLVYDGKWEFMPVRSVRPFALEPRPDLKVAKVRVVVVDPDGREVPLQLVLCGPGQYTKVASGEEVMLRHGEQVPTSMQSLGWLAPILDSARFVVSDTSPPGGQARITLPERVCMLRIVPKPAKLPAPAVFHLRVFDDQQRGGLFTNRVPEAGPFELAMPYGKAKVTLSTTAYQDWEREVDCNAPSVSLEVPLISRL